MIVSPPTALFLQLKPSSNTIPVKLVTSFLISFPLAALLKRIPDSRPEVKNLFAIGYANSLLSTHG